MPLHERTVPTINYAKIRAFSNREGSKLILHPKHTVLHQFGWKIIGMRMHRFDKLMSPHLESFHPSLPHHVNDIQTHD